MAIDSAAAVIGKSVQIRGEVKGSEDLVVEGHLEGTITLTESRLTIGAHASVTANVAARDVILLGRLNGNVKASGRVELRKGCELAGDISANRLSIEENAIFRGRVDLAQPGEKGAVAAVPALSAPAPNAPIKTASGETSLFRAAQK